MTDTKKELLALREKCDEVNQRLISMCIVFLNLAYDIVDRPKIPNDSASYEIDFVEKGLLFVTIENTSFKFKTGKDNKGREETNISYSVDAVTYHDILDIVRVPFASGNSFYRTIAAQYKAMLSEGTECLRIHDLLRPWNDMMVKSVSLDFRVRIVKDFIMPNVVNPILIITENEEEFDSMCEQVIDALNGSSSSSTLVNDIQDKLFEYSLETGYATSQIIEIVVWMLRVVNYAGLLDCRKTLLNK